MGGGRTRWVNDADRELIITWCGNFWHIGHRDEAGKCKGYVSSPNDALCFEDVRDIRYYVHCTNEWVDGGPSKVRITCLDNLRRKEKWSNNYKIDPRASNHYEQIEADQARSNVEKVKEDKSTENGEEVEEDESTENTP